MRRITFFVMALALVLGSTQCKKEEVQPQNQDGQVSITLNVDNGSKAIVDPNASQMVTFKSGDKIIVANGGYYRGYLEHDGSGFSGTITNPTEGQPLYFYFLGNKVNPSTELSVGTSTGIPVNISDQTGELPIISMGESLDGEGKSLNYSAGMTSFTARLQNYCSLMKFNVTTPSTAPICITGMCNTVSVGFTNNTIGEAFQDNGLIMMKGVTSENPETWAVVLAQSALEEGEGVSTTDVHTTGLLYTADHFYSGVRPGIPEIVRGYKYNDAIVMTANTDTYNALTTPLTFEAKTTGSTVTFNINTSVATNPVEYNKNAGGWQTYTSGTVIELENVGDKVMFRGSNNNYAVNSYASKFSCSESSNVYVYGNVMSLFSHNFESSTTIPAQELNNYYQANASALAYLFEGNTHIDISASRELVLPATTLAGNCYERMFSGCTGLTKAPALPATTLTYSCYYGMFNGCSNLTAAPLLPAPTLTTYCYSNMFQGCSKLASVTCLATSTGGENDFDRLNNWWLDGVASTGTFTKAENSIAWQSGGKHGIPEGWTVQVYGGK